MLLVDDDHAKVRERGDQRQARADHDIGPPAPDAPPLVRPLAIAQTGVHERDVRGEIGPQSVHEREGHRDLGHEHEGRAAGRQRRDDGLHVDGRLAGTGHPVEEQRARVARRDRALDEGGRVGLGTGQVRRRRAATARPGYAGRERPAWALADLRHGQSAPDEPGQPGRPVAGREIGARSSIGTGGRQLAEGVGLSWAERTAGGLAPGRQGRGRDDAVRRDRDPALEARAGGTEERPVECQQTIIGEPAQASDRAGSSIGTGQVADRPGTRLELLEQVAIDLVEISSGRTRCPLGDELEPLQEPGGSIARMTRAGGAR